MTPQTRSSKKDDMDSKIYRSRRAPQQAYFPHKRKTVRRPSPPAPNGSDKRQMIFLREKMRENSSTAVKDSDDDGESEDIEEQSAVGITKRGSKKRGQDTMQDDNDEVEPSRPTRKRRRNDTPKQKRRQKQIKVGRTDEHNRATSDLEDPMSRRHIRQSTMTQLVEGRRPLVDDETVEPKFKPLKRSPRLSWAGKRKEKAADKKQRTLTQMVPRMRPSEVMSDDDMEEALGDLESKDENSQEYDDMVAQRLAKQGLHRVETDSKNETSLKSLTEEVIPSLVNDRDHEEIQDDPFMSVENPVGLDEDYSYQPTQYIDAPATRGRRTSPRQKNTHDTESHAANTQSTKSSKAPKPRFGLLSTPEKQRVHEIPSSQSPAESPLFTQNFSPYRSPLQERSGNAVNVLKTPSKLKKVSFQEVENERNVSPTLKRFHSTIQDSEDEEEDSIEETMSLSRGRISAQMQSPLSVDETGMDGQEVGAETQAVLEQIDQACAHVNGDIPSSGRETQQQPPGSCDVLEQQPYLAAHTGIKREPSHDECLADIPPISTASLLVKAEAGSMQPLEELHSTPPLNEVFPQETLPSTPMMLEDESSDEDEGGSNPLSSSRTKGPIPQPVTNNAQPSEDPNSEIIQCPRSPSPNHETQQSHSSRAELQLQNEWFSYSQYVSARSPQSSSMHATHDPFSHIATPAPLHRNTPSPPPSGPQRSQATTVDEVTPRRDRTQCINSANVTPHRGGKSYTSIVSPSKLPPLFIPSSFPDTMEAGVDEWSSPPLQETQAAGGYAGNLSWEEFSIPLPPPPEESEEA